MYISLMLPSKCMYDVAFTCKCWKTGHCEDHSNISLVLNVGSRTNLSIGLGSYALIKYIKALACLLLLNIICSCNATPLYKNIYNFKFTGK